MMYTAHERFGYFGYERQVYVDKRLAYMPYAQAGVRFDEQGNVTLISYSTPVIIIDADGWMICTGTYSQTTRKHIGAFLKEWGNGATYQIAKKCYTDGLTYNVRTGEIKGL